MGELKNKYDKHMPDYVGLGTYAVVGAVLKWLMTFPCGASFESVVNPYAIGFILSGIGFGLISFIYRNRFGNLSGIKKSLFETARGAITGFSIGWGGVTAWILLCHPCG